MVPSNDFDTLAWLCQGADCMHLFLVSDRSRNLSCRVAWTTCCVLHEAIVQISQVQGCNRANLHSIWTAPASNPETFHTNLKANSKIKIRNAERIKFIPVSYIVGGEWQGQRRLLVAFQWWESCRTVCKRAVSLQNSNCLFLHFLYIVSYFSCLTNSYCSELFLAIAILFARRNKCSSSRILLPAQPLLTWLNRFYKANLYSFICFPLFMPVVPFKKWRSNDRETLIERITQHGKYCTHSCSCMYCLL